MPLALECAVEKHWPFDLWAEHRVVVAVSGGADSVALVRALHAIASRRGCQGHLAVAHFNHRLRGAESDQDEAFVRSLADELAIPVFVGQAEIPPQSAEAARDARYEFLARAAESAAARYLATAHTADDQAETILHRIVRGTGLEGLGGIPAFRSLTAAVTLVRPLLETSRSEVLAYLSELGQPFREDSSNQSLQSTRSRIRHVVLPSLKRENPEVAAALRRLGAQAAAAQEVIARLADSVYADAVTRSGPSWRIDCPKLATHPAPVIHACLARLWREAGWPESDMGQREWDELMRMVLDPGAPRRDFPGAIDAHRRQAALELIRRPPKG